MKEYEADYRGLVATSRVKESGMTYSSSTTASVALLQFMYGNTAVLPDYSVTWDRNWCMYTINRKTNQIQTCHSNLKY